MYKLYNTENDKPEIIAILNDDFSISGKGSHYIKSALERAKMRGLTDKKEILIYLSKTLNTGYMGFG